jgi:hypothetical protein
MPERMRIGIWDCGKNESDILRLRAIRFPEIPHHALGRPKLDKSNKASQRDHSLLQTNEALWSSHRILPWQNIAHLALSQLGADRAIDVITFKTDFKPSGFDRPVTEYFKNQVLSRLTRAGIATLTVIIKRDRRRELVLRFDGPDQDVTRAKAAFDET